MIWWSDDYNCALKISVFDDDGIEFFIWQQVYWISSDSSEKQAVKNGRPLLQTMADLPNVTIIKQQRLDNRATSIYSIMLEATESLFTLRIKKPKWLILGPLRKIESNKQHQYFFSSLEHFLARFLSELSSLIHHERLSVRPGFHTDQRNMEKMPRKLSFLDTSQCHRAWKFPPKKSPK